VSSNAEDERASRAPRRARVHAPDSPGRPFLVAVCLGVLAFAGCAPAPIYLSHHRDSGGGEAPPATSLDTADIRGFTLTAPLDDMTAKRILSRFGPRNTNGGPGSANHQGVDIKASSGEAVRAAAAGTVAFCGQERGYGNLVILDHGNGITTYYAHLFQASVRRGERVGAGEAIGRAGKDGTATTTHLHFELRRRDKPIDPMPYLMACLRAA
jgi:murein DD-endopeptidase MepM/ murein hydrolase activator NlpD